MMQKIGTSFILLNVVLLVRSEPPVSGGYGAPLAAPISSYGTPNYHANNFGNNDYSGGHGDHKDQHNEPQAYEFGYQVKDDHTHSNYNQHETSDGNQVRGQYKVDLPDGRTQIVTYWADWKTGYHADVKYEGEAQYPQNYNTDKGFHNAGYGGSGSGGYGSHQYQGGNAIHGSGTGNDGYNYDSYNNGYSH